MASKNIDQLAAASTLSDTDKVVVAQGDAVLKRGTLAQLRTWACNDQNAGGSYHTDIGSSDPSLRRFAGRAFYGRNSNDNATFNAQGTNPGTTEEAKVLHSWATRDSQLNVSSQIGSMAIVGVTQSSHRSALGGWPALPAGTPAAIGVSGFAINDVNTGTLGQGWGVYADSVRFPGAGFSVGIEAAVANLGADVLCTPYSLKATGGLTVASWLQSGCGLDLVGYDGRYGAVGNLTAYVAMLSSFSTGTVASRPKALTGIIVTPDALVDRSAGSDVYEFASLPQRTQISWYRPNGTQAGYIWFSGVDGSGSTGIDINNGQININATSGLLATELNVVDANFRLRISSGEPRTTVDVNDYWSYDRANNNMNFFINNVRRFQVNPFVTNVAGGLSIDGNAAILGRVAGWAVPTGTLTRTTFDTATVTLPQLAERVAALIRDIHTNSATNVQLLQS